MVKINFLVFPFRFVRTHARGECIFSVVAPRCRIILLELFTFLSPQIILFKFDYGYFDVFEI